MTLFDTADIYTGGDSETFLGKALAGRRDGVAIVTKFGDVPAGSEGWPDAPAAARGSRAYVRWAVEASLRRLGTDWIDVYLHHWPDPTTPIEVTIEAMAELVAEGKIRYMGCSNYDADQLRRAKQAADGVGQGDLVAFQSRYSLINRQAEDSLLPACRSVGVGFMAYFPLEGGLLTGKLKDRANLPETSRLATASGEYFVSDAALTHVDALERYARERDVTLVEVAIGGLLAHEGVTCVLTGATTPEQIRSNVTASTWQPGPADLRDLRGEVA